MHELAISSAVLESVLRHADGRRVTSVKLRLKKAGYEDYEQIVVDDTPLSIRMRPNPPPAPTTSVTSAIGLGCDGSIQASAGRT